MRAGARAPPQAGPGARGLSQVTPALPPALGGRLEKTQAGRILASAPPAVGPGARKENVPSPVALLLCCPLASRGFRSVGCHSSADGRRPVSLCLCSPRGQAESPPARVGGLSGCPLRQGPGDGKAARRTLGQLSGVGSWGPDQGAGQDNSLAALCKMFLTSSGAEEQVSGRQRERFQFGEVNP